MLPRQQPEVQFAQQLRLKDRYGGRAVQESDKATGRIGNVSLRRQGVVFHYSSGTEFSR